MGLVDRLGTTEGWSEGAVETERYAIEFINWFDARVSLDGTIDGETVALSGGTVNGNVEGWQKNI